LGYYLNGSNLVFEGRPLDVIERFGDEVDTESARKQRVLKRMELELTKLASDFTVYVVDPTPRMTESIPEAMKRAVYRGEDVNALGVPREEYELAAKDFFDLFAKLEKAGVKRVAIADQLCPHEMCINAIDGDPIYRDSHHLTSTLGAGIVVDKILEEMGGVK
ncbi:SGNH hydrolase domain-containing protein, partial [Oleiphilus sp. HI0079]|uniref:SGNH hydrolase domain-containing protein n=2 Tax=unclassified Oleiphilus TaxID=2631174 RepID=UPI000A49B441